jgi:hypothetical protein
MMKLTLGLSISTGHSRFWKFLFLKERTKKITLSAFEASNQKGVKLDPSPIPNSSTPLV